MRNFKNIIKKSSFKTISLVLALALLLQTVSIAVTAISESGLSIDEMVSIDDSSETIPSIVGEVESNRDEYTKVYELSDGSFYEIISNEPIHKNVDGQWEEPVNNMDMPESVDEVTAYCDELVESVLKEENDSGVSTFSFNVHDTNERPISSFYVVSLEEGNLVNNMRMKTEKNCLMLKIDDSLLSLPNTNQLVIKQNLFIECSDPTVSDTESALSAYPILDSWFIGDDNYLWRNTNGNTTSITGYDVNCQSNILDSFTLNSNVVKCEFDITEICHKWRKGIVENNGLMFYISGENSSATIDRCFLTRRYLIIDAYDTDFTYHSIDMGHAGQVLINDLTNTITIQRNEAHFPSGAMPINLYRYFDFSKTYLSLNPAGEGSHWNFECPLTNETETCTAWEAFDGRTIRFTRKNASETEWIGDQNEEYILDTSEAENILDDNYDGAFIKTPDDWIYTFGAKGKIKRIDDGNGNYIVVRYNGATDQNNSSQQDYITSIENNSGYRFEFIYENVFYTLSDGTKQKKKTLTTIEYKKKISDTIYENVLVDGVPYVISYEYIILPNKNIALSKVKQPISNTENIIIAEYEYDANGRLKSIIDIDKRKLDIDYKYMLDPSDPTTELDNYPSASTLKEYVLNDEYSEGVQNIEEYLLISSLEIDRKNTYHRTFKNELNEEESFHYTKQFELLYYTSDNGNNYFVDYGQKGDETYISQIVSPENKSTEIGNPGFESVRNNTTKPIGWSESGGINTLQSIEGELNGEGNRIAQIEGSFTSVRAASQFVEIQDAKEGDILVVGCHAKANAAVTTDSHFFGIEVYKAITDDYGDYYATNELLYRLAFDPTMDNETQFRLGAFKLNEDINTFQFKLVYSYQTGFAYFDNALMYVSSEENVTFFDEPSDNDSTNTPSDNEPNVASNSANTYVDVLSDGTDEMIAQYVYSPYTNQLTEFTDNNNITTKYEYENDTGFLKQKSIKTGADSSTLIDKYTYNAMGMLKEVTRVIDATQNTTSTSYTYEYNKISSVVHNNMTYKFDYNSYGDLESITVNPNSATETPLINYDYTLDKYRNINKITYSNGRVLEYEYDNGRVTSVSSSSPLSPSSKTLYSYTYDGNGNITEIWDYTSRRVMTYSNNLFKVYELAENSNTIDDAEQIYSKSVNNNSEEYEIFSVEYTKTPIEPIYDDIHKTTTYSSSTSIEGEYPIMFESVAVSDYFGRIKTSSVSYTPENSSNTHSIVNESEYLNISNETVTTNLLKTYKTTITNGNQSSNENSSSSGEPTEFFTTYDYDSAGRITRINYGDNINALLPAFDYEYDNAGQLIKEADYLGKTYTEYTYNSYGNITKKTIYSGISYNEENDTIVTTEATKKEIEFRYQESYGDVLRAVVIDGHTKEFDLDYYGNPDKYYKIDGNTIEMFSLAWEGNQLHSVTSADDELTYEYKYDDEGRRTQKIAYSNSSEGRELALKMDYIWDANKIMGYKICFLGEERTITIEAIILYDELENPIGLKYNMDGLTDEEDNLEFAEEDVFWFIKDGNGNVKALYSEKTKYTIGCNYANDQISINVSESFKEELNKKIEEADNFKRKLLIALAYVATSAAAPLISIEASKSTYYSYIMDIETGLYYCQNRYYSPEYSRFINVDSFERITYDLENPFNANPFVYCNNDPVNCSGTSSNSKPSSNVVGIQAELSKSLVSFADSVGIEFIYDHIKDELYAYYYNDVRSNSDYSTRAINQIQNFLNEVSFSSSVSLKNLATIFKINNSISLSYFDVQSNKGFILPSSYMGISKIKPNKASRYRGYVAYGNTYQAEGVCYFPTSNIGFGVDDMSVKYQKIEFESSLLKDYLSANRNNIIAITK